MGKLIETLRDDILIRSVFNPRKGIDGPGFFTIFLLQYSLASVTGLITGKAAVVFALTLFLFLRLVRARISAGGSSKLLPNLIAVIISAGVTLLVTMEHFMIYFFNPHDLMRGFEAISGFMRVSVVCVRYGIIACILFSFIAVFLLAVFPGKKNSWAKWRRTHVRPLLSPSGSINRITFIFLMFFIQVLTFVTAFITAAVVLLISLSAGWSGGPSPAVIPALVIASLVLCLLLFASICALLRRIRDLGHTWRLLVGVIILSVFASAIALYANPAISNLVWQLGSNRLGLSTLYWSSFYLSPVLADILGGIRVIWAITIFYLVFFPGRSKERF